LKSPYESSVWQDFLQTFRKTRLVFTRIQGSHHIYGKAGSILRLTVPLHGNQTLKIGLQKHLMKQAGMTESDL
jgi:predicted RNA binding protein YcfA (HicA-like mRNA interferase family)